MKGKKKIKYVSIAFIASTAFLSCFFKKEYVFNEGFIQGTTYSIIYESLSGNDYHEDIQKILEDFDQSLSTYIPGSIISRINRNDTSVFVDHYFKTVFLKSKEVFLATNGAFDITIAPAVNAWGFGFSSINKHRDSLLIDSLLQYVGMQKVELAGNKIQKACPEIMLDVNAIAQGYSVDVVADFLDKKNILNYLIEIGGEVKAKGVNRHGETWRVGVDKPIDNSSIPGEELQTIIQLKNKSLATSGNYRKFFEENGIKYSHTIDPKTGYPAKNTLLSASVIAGDCITADAYATAFMVMGLERSKNFLEKHKELLVYFVYTNSKGDYEVFTGQGVKEMLVD